MMNDPQVRRQRDGLISPSPFALIEGYGFIATVEQVTARTNVAVVFCYFTGVTLAAATLRLAMELSRKMSFSVG